MSRVADSTTRMLMTRRQVSPTGYNAVYINSTPALGAVRWLPSHPRVFFHVHELANARAQSLAPQDQHLITDIPDAYAVASQAVKDDLVGQLGIDPGRVTVVHEFPAVADRPPTDDEVKEVRRRLCVDDGARIVLACGTSDHRKGPDLFLQAALSYRHTHPDASVHWVWLGGGPFEHDDTRFREEIAAAGVGTRVHFVPAVSDPDAVVRRRGCLLPDLPGRPLSTRHAGSRAGQHSGRRLRRFWRCC